MEEKIEMVGSGCYCFLCEKELMMYGKADPDGILLDLESWNTHMGITSQTLEHAVTQFRGGNYGSTLIDDDYPAIIYFHDACLNQKMEMVIRVLHD